MITPENLAVELGIDTKVIRRKLRQLFGVRYGRWELTQEQANQVTLHLAGSHRVRFSRSPASGLPSIIRMFFPSITPEFFNSLKENPQVVTIRVSGSDKVISLYPVIKVANLPRRRSYHRVALLGNGQPLSTKDLPNSRTVASETYLDIQYFWELTNGRALHKDYVEELQHVRVPEFLEDIIIPKAAHEHDTPQSLVLLHYSQLAKAIMGNTQALFNLAFSKGIELSELTLRDVFSLKNLPSRSRYYLDDSAGPITSYLSTINLLEVPPDTHSGFNISLSDIYRRFGYEVGIKASELRKEVAEKYGFVHEPDQGWLKRKESDKVWIKNDLRVFVNDRPICIVSAISTNLPHDDEVARRMLTVATEYRGSISTIRGGTMEALERLFG